MKIQYSHAVLILLLPLTYIHAQATALTPPDAKPGECYARVVLPAQYETIEDKVMVKEPSEEIKIIPAEYGTKEEEIEVTPSIKKLTPIPAIYKETTETIEVKPAMRIWKTSLNAKALPASTGLLKAAKEYGIDLLNTSSGECFKEYFVPQKFKTISEEVLVHNEYNETKVIPAEFETVEKTVVIKPASKKVVEVPAVYEETEEKVLVEAEKTVWKKGQNPAQKVSGATGEIMCLVKIPAKYKTIKKRILKSPATTKVVDVPEETKIIKVKKLIVDTHIENTPMPALYKTIEKIQLESNATFSWHNTKEQIDAKFKYAGHQICLSEEPAKTKEVKKIVLDTPASVDEEILPKEVVAVEVQQLITPSKEEKTPIAAEYKIMQKRKKISDTHIEWKRILCQTNMDKAIIAKLQTALGEKGYLVGKADGVLGKDTRNALDKFQRDSSLATGGITYETLNALGITL